MLKKLNFIKYESKTALEITIRLKSNLLSNIIIKNGIINTVLLTMYVYKYNFKDLT